MNPTTVLPTIKPPLSLRVTDTAGTTRAFVAIPAPPEPDPPPSAWGILGYKVRRRDGEAYPGSDYLPELDEAVARWVAAGVFAFELVALGIDETVAGGDDFESTWTGQAWTPWGDRP